MQYQDMLCRSFPFMAMWIERGGFMPTVQSPTGTMTLKGWWYPAMIHTFMCQLPNILVLP